MFDFIPVAQYTHYFDIAILVMVLITFWLCQRGIILNREVVNINASWGFVFAILLILYMGLRPVSSEFGDTMNYYRYFREYMYTPFKWEWGTDFLFYNLMHWFASYYDIHSFFLLCAFLYVFPLWLAMERIFKSYYFVPFLILLCMFTFWQYGVNGVRNGVASSLFILSLTYINNIPIASIIAIIATGFHASIVIVFAAAILAWFFEKTYYYLIGWILCIPISYLAGFTIQNYIGGLGLSTEDVRFSSYLTMTEEQMISEGLVVSMTFRWDFLLYSALAVVVGYYFIFRRNFKDEYYKWFFNIYLITNAFWILVIRSAYSNRFAQISWFIMPIVLIYPFMKKRFWINHEKMLGYAILAFYAFAFYQNILK